MLGAAEDINPQHGVLAAQVRLGLDCVDHVQELVAVGSDKSAPTTPRGKQRRWRDGKATTVASLADLLRKRGAEGGVGDGDLVEHREQLKSGEPNGPLGVVGIADQNR